MTARLKSRAERIAALPRYRAPDPGKQTNVEAALRLLADRPMGKTRDPEPWDDFLRRIGVIA